MGGLLDAAVAHGERVIELAAELGRDADRRRAIARHADILMEGHQARALEILNATLAEPGMAPGTPGYTAVATALAKLEMRLLNDRRAVELADQVLPVAQEEGDDRLIIDLLITRGVALYNLGRSTEAVVMLTGALDVAHRLNLKDLYNRAAVNLGFAVAQEDPQRAFEVSRSAIDDARRDGIVWGIRYIVGNAVDAAIELGEWDWAMQTMGEFDALFTEAAERIWFGTYSGVIRALRGEDVSDQVHAVYEESQRFDDHQYRAVGAYGALVSAFIRGELDETIRISERSMQESPAGIDSAIYGARAALWKGDLETGRMFRDRFAATNEARRTLAMTAAMDGGIAALEGRAADARSHFVDAQRRCRELGCQYFLAMIDLDIVVTGAMEADERRAAAEEARAIFTRLEASALLELLDRAVEADAARAGTRPVVSPPKAMQAEAEAEGVAH